MVAGHRLTIDQALLHANCEAFLSIKKRDLYNLDPQDTLLGELDPAYQGLIIPECSPESPDLESIIGNSVNPETKERIMNAVNQSLASNRDKVQVLDSTIRSLYSAASRLVNNGAEILRSFGLVKTALDVRQQSIVRKAGPFAKPASSVAEPKPGP